MAHKKPETANELQLAIWRLDLNVSSANKKIRDAAINRRVKLREQLTEVLANESE